ncbi:MAG: NAD-binding protein [Candidatus Hydrothermarchaeaceae archaeon]
MKRRALAVALFVFILIFGGSLGFMYIEGKTFLESLYFVIATITTVGYGDIVPVTEAGIIFSIILIMFGACAVLATIPLAFRYLVEKDIRAALGFETIPKLKGHIIICRYNDLADQALEEIKARDIPYIIIENDEDLTGKLRDLDMPCVNGDPGEERVLKKAMIEDARSIILASTSDSENTFIAIAARELNPRIKIIARVNSSETVPIYKSVDIDIIIDPLEVTLKTLVKNALSPYAADLLDEISLFKDVNLGQFQVSKDSVIYGKRISDTEFREKTGASIVAVLEGDEMYPNPSMDRVIQKNDVLLVLGTLEQLQKAKALVEEKTAKRKLKELARDVADERVRRMEAASEIRTRLPKVLINLMVVLGLFFAITVVMPSLNAAVGMIPRVGLNISALLPLMAWLVIGLIVFRMLDDIRMLLNLMSENLTGLFPGVTKRGCLDRVLRDVIFAVMIVVFFAIVSPLASGVSPAFRTLISILSIVLPFIFLYDAARVLSEHVRFFVDRVAERVAGEIEKGGEP